MSETHDAETGEVYEPPAMQSLHIGELAGALAKAQGEIKGAAKDAENPFFSSRYSDLASVWDACRGPLSVNELSVTQATDFEDGQIVLITTLAHSSGQWTRGRLPIRPMKQVKGKGWEDSQDPQSIGSAITYARRYALAAIAGVSPADDDGEAASGRGGRKSDPPEKQSADFGERTGGPIRDMKRVDRAAASKPADAKGRSAEGTPHSDPAWDTAESIKAELAACETLEDLKTKWKLNNDTARILPADVREYLEGMKDQFKDSLTAAA